MKTLWKAIGVVSVVAMMTCFGSYSAIGGDDAGYPEETMVIRGKKPVKFSHTSHLGIGIRCEDCHHDASHQGLTADAIAGLEDKDTLKCMTCHNENFAVQKLQKRKDAYHANCRTCHNEEYNGKKGPNKCSGCHEKKKRQGMEGC